MYCNWRLMWKKCLLLPWSNSLKSNIIKCRLNELRVGLIGGGKLRKEENDVTDANESMTSARLRD